MAVAGFPLILIVAWGVKMQEILPHSTCWEGYRSYDVVWLLTGPKLVVLLVSIVTLNIDKTASVPSKELLER